MDLTHLTTQDNTHSLSPVVSKVPLKSKDIYVVRDDLLPGGTKQRAAIPYIAALARQGVKHVVYASPFSGYAQVSLAHACSKAGLSCTLFCIKENKKYIHDFSLMAQEFGAQVRYCTSYDECSKKAKKMTSNTDALKLIPLGFNDSLFKNYLKADLLFHWNQLTKRYPIKELWLPIGSGTLLSVFKSFIGPSIKVYGVDINILNESDKRIQAIKNNEEVTYIKTMEKFHESSKSLPPLPSNLYYDAKLFTHLVDKATDGAFWWNVAK